VTVLAPPRPPPAPARALGLRLPATRSPTDSDDCQGAGGSVAFVRRARSPAQAGSGDCATYYFLDRASLYQVTDCSSQPHTASLKAYKKLP
jgi:hypothetical protein